MQFVRFSYYKTANRTAPCGVVQCGVILLAVWCGLYGFLIIKPQTALHHAVWCGVVRCKITCGAVQLYHFADGFDVVFAVCAVW